MEGVYKKVSDDYNSRPAYSLSTSTSTFYLDFYVPGTISIKINTPPSNEMWRVGSLQNSNAMKIRAQDNATSPELVSVVWEENDNDKEGSTSSSSKWEESPNLVVQCYTGNLQCNK